MIDYLHLPVLVDEVVGNLVTKPDGAYLDLTVGLGGHLKAISKATSSGARLYGLDRDGKAVVLAKENLKDCKQTIRLVCASYDTIDEVVGDFENKEFDGILLDLGISSLQLDDPQRGFSFRFDGPLDMRFDSDAESRTAGDLINTLSEKEIAEIIKVYGEERSAGRLARAIVRERQKEMILTTSQLSEIVKRNVKPVHANKSLARVFQAFRIAVNGELERLEEVLPKIVDILKINGRLAVLTYHSLEDRIIKSFFRKLVKGCVCPDSFDICVCGVKPTLKIITRKAIKPSETELTENSRARSAKLRVAERVAV